MLHTLVAIGQSRGGGREAAGGRLLPEAASLSRRSQVREMQRQGDMLPLRKMSLAFIPALFAGALSLSSAGCAPAEVRISAAVTTPRLIWIGPGVWVVEDYPWSVYYHDGFYWMYRDGLWYRSDYYSDGYVRVGIRVVPIPVVRIHRPHRYVRYRATRDARVRVIERRRDRSDRVPERRSHDHRR